MISSLAYQISVKESL